MTFNSLSLQFIVLFTGLLLYGNTASSQQNENKFWEHVRFGGGIGLSFGDGFFSGTLAPSAIYEFDSQFALGFGLEGTFNKRKNFYRSTIWGGSLIGLFNPIEAIQLSAEFVELNVNRKWDNYLAIEDEKYWYPALFVGAGYRTQNITFGLRYDLLYDEEKSIFADAWMPFVRVYF